MFRTLSNRLGALPLWARVVLAVLVMVAIAHVPAASAAVVGGAVIVKAMVIIPWQPALTRAELDEEVSPSNPNQPEVIPWQLYDTQSQATGVSTTLVFYQTIQGDKTLGNMEGPGQLPDPQYFVVHYAACDILQVPVATALASEPNGGWANVENMLKTCRASFELNMSNKRYGPFSLTMCHATGGATGAGYGYGTAANGTSAGLVNNGVPGSGGFPFGGALVIPPKIGFDVKILWGTAPTLVGGPINIRFSLVGALYRRVL